MRYTRYSSSIKEGEFAPLRGCRLEKDHFEVFTVCASHTQPTCVRTFQQLFITSEELSFHTELLVSAGLDGITGIAVGMVFVELNAGISMLQFPHSQNQGQRCLPAL